MDSLLAGKPPIDNPPDLWIRVNAIDDAQIGMFPDKIEQGDADLLERLAEVLTTVSGNQHLLCCARHFRNAPGRSIVIKSASITVLPVM